MKQKLNLLFFTLILSLSTSTFAAPMCSDLIGRIPVVQKVVISKEDFNKTTENLRATLSGKLATVWRSEWKTKLTVEESNLYVLDLVNSSLTPATRDIVLKDNDVRAPGFTREVHARLADLQNSGRTSPDDNLKVRDLPTPAGAKDQAFTYYAKPITNIATPGKHQLRVRSYIRNVLFAEIPVGKSVDGYNAQGCQIVISRVKPNLYSVLTMNKNNAPENHMLTTEQIQVRFGGPRTSFFAPHGKSFKLEIKTALDDVISGALFPMLQGNHMVQKLDVSLSPSQVSKLFAPMNLMTSAQKVSESLRRIEEIQNEITAKSPEALARSNAVFNVIKLAVQNNSNYLVIEGATVYNRTAFESKDGFQTTIDRGQMVYEGNMYDATSLKSPVLTMKENTPRYSPSESDARHVEFKLPVTSMLNVTGITYANPTAAPAPQNVENTARVQQMVTVYHNYVKSTDHPGKFNYIRKNSEPEE